MPNDKFLNADDTVDLIKTGTTPYLPIQGKYNESSQTQYAEAYFLIDLKNKRMNNTVTFRYRYTNSEYTPVIDWGDGTTEQLVLNSTSISHTYSNQKMYRIKVTANAPVFGFALGDNTNACISPGNIVKDVKIYIDLSNSYFGKSFNFLNPYCFYASNNLKNIFIDAKTSITGADTINIPNYCFAGCENLETFKIHFSYGSISNYMNLGDYSFADCVCLKNIFVDYGFTDYNNNERVKNMFYWSILNMGTNCFRGCQNLNIPHCNLKPDKTGQFTEIYYKTISISFDTGTFAKNYLYYNNANLTFIVANSTPPTVPSDLQLSADTTIFVPQGSLTAWRTATGWSNYANQIFEKPITQYKAIDGKLDKSGGALTGDVTTTNTTFTSTSLVTKQYVDDTIAALNGNNTSY